MTDLYSQFSAQPSEPLGDDGAREARHQVLATLLGAYADGELPPETASQIDAHLLGCTRCRREVEVHRALNRRLAREPLVPASQGLRDRVMAGVAAAPRPAAPVVAPTVAPRTRRGLVGAAVVLLVAAAAAWALRPAPDASAPVVAVSGSPLLTSVVADYRRATAGDLPGRARDLDAVRASVPFRVEPLQGAGLRLLAVWSTDLDGEPAAVLAYRWSDRLVLQYLVAEPQFFRSPGIRAQIAAGGQVLAADGAQGVLGWAARESGVILVADAGPGELAGLRLAEAAR